jgi:hypothetical protein
VRAIQQVRIRIDVMDPVGSALLPRSGAFRPEVAESIGVASALVGFQRGEQQVRWGRLRAFSGAIPTPSGLRQHQAGAHTALTELLENLVVRDGLAGHWKFSTNMRSQL